MTTGLAGLGVCHVVTAAGLRPAALPGRVVLAIGGLATIAVAAFPQPVTGSSAAHFRAAAVGFTTLAGWTALAWRRERPAPVALHLPVDLAAAAGLFAALGWFVYELSSDGGAIGLSERVVAGSQALWPLVVVLSARRSAATRY